VYSYVIYGLPSQFHLVDLLLFRPAPGTELEVILNVTLPMTAALLLSLAIFILIKNYLCKVGLIIFVNLISWVLAFNFFKNCVGEGCLVIAGLLLYIFFTAIVFILLLIIDVFREKISSKLMTILTLILALLFIAFLIISLISDFEYKSQEREQFELRESNKEIINENFTDIDKAFRTCNGLLKYEPYTAQECFSQLAIAKNDMSICNYARSFSTYYCYYPLGYNDRSCVGITQKELKDISQCTRIEFRRLDEPYAADTPCSKSSSDASDLAWTEVSYQADKAECALVAAEEFNSPASCLEITDPLIRDPCLYRTGINTLNIDTCLLISIDGWRGGCIYEVVKKTGRKEDCELIPDKELVPPFLKGMDLRKRCYDGD
jgi:hypothetical protein